MIHVGDRIKNLPKWAQEHIKKLEQASRIGKIPVTIRMADGTDFPTMVLALPRKGEVWSFIDKDRDISGRVASVTHFDTDGELSLRVRIQNL